MNEVEFDDSCPVDGYGPGFFRIGGKILQGPVMLMPGGILSWAGFEDVVPLLRHADEVDFFLIGTGESIAPPPGTFRQTLEGAGIGLEVMASPAACRTYNVLLAEGRRAGAAMLPI